MPRKTAPNPNNRMSKAERDELRQKLAAYGMELEKIPGRGRAPGQERADPSRWELIKKDPFLLGIEFNGTPAKWTLTFGKSRRQFWRLKHVAEFIAEVEKNNALLATVLEAQRRGENR